MKKWINTHKFREDALFFQENGYYDCGVYGTQEYRDWWKERERRCKEGYTSDDQYITGDHYFYLNFTKIKLKEDTSKTKRKQTNFPEFWDGDAEYFRIFKECEEEGKHLIVAKARRKGYSYKNAAIAVNRCLLYPEYEVSLGAYEKKYLTDIGALYSFVDSHINFINEHTAWGRQALIDRPSEGEYKWGYVEYENGIPIEKGYKSSITSYGQLGKNPGALRGKSKELIFYEEAGAFPNLIQAVKPVIDTLKDGNVVTGMLVIFGTGGGESSNWADFEEIFYNPEQWGFKSFDNIWEPESAYTKCGFFHPYSLNLKGTDKNGNPFMDSEGNSFTEIAVKEELEIRETLIDNPTALAGKMMENPLTPSDAFLKTTANDFPVKDLSQQLQFLKAGDKATKLAFIGELYEDKKTNQIKWRVNKKKAPVNKYPLRKTEDKIGCPVIWEMPFKNEFDEVPDGLYEASLDPYSQDESDTSTSLASLLIRKRNVPFCGEGDKLVLEYSGRPETTTEYYNILILCLEFYNCKVMAENMFKDFFTYLISKGKEHLLAPSPTDVIDSHIKKSTVQRKYGSHMTKELRLAGLRYIKNWLLQERGVDDNGKSILNLHTIKSIPLLQELILFDVAKGNFDRIDSFIQLMFFREQTFKNEIKEFKQKSDLFSTNIGKRRKQVTKFR